MRLRDHGITPGFVYHAHAHGFNTTDAEELIRLKNGGLWKDRSPLRLAANVNRRV